MLRKNTNILKTVPEGRHIDGKDTQTIVQISSESAGLDLIFKISIRGRDNANIYSARAILPYTLEDAFLQNAKQLTL